MPQPDDRMLREVGARQERMLRAKKEGSGSFWSSLQILGVVGWSVALPTLVGVSLGMFLDRRVPQHFSWTVALLFAGLLFGCTNAWLHLREKR